MVKVLLVYDDYNEMTLTESYLKKIGIDALGISNEAVLNDQLLGFRPEIIVTSGRSQRVNSLSVALKLKENHKYQGKVIILLPKNFRPEPSEILRIKMDAMMEAPVFPEKLIQVLAKLGGFNADIYLEKLAKSRLTDNELDKKIMHVTGSPPPYSAKPMEAKDLLVDPERMKKYQKFIDPVKLDAQSSSHQRAAVKAAQENLKKSWDFKELEQQDELKRQFAEALFRKK